MAGTLHKDSILAETLFYVAGDLVENYNRSLEKLVGKRTALAAFHIDKRGESPEIEAELGEHYLQTGRSHRYCIVISPDQKETGLIDEEFSFDHEVLNELYKNFLSGISLATRVDGLYGELDDDVRAYETFEDILLIKKVRLEMHTPSGFLHKARQLQEYVRQLENNPNLLIEDDSALLRKILDMVSQVGDVRSYNLNPIVVTKELTTFFSRFFDGVWVFRSFVPRTSLQMKRPDVQPYLAQQLSNGVVAIENLPDNLLSEPPPLPGSTPPAAPPAQKGPPKTVVIYQQAEEQPEDGPSVTFIPLQDKQRVIQFLVAQNYAAYAYELLEARLSRVEDETLLQKNYAVTGLDREQRAQALHQHRDAMLPEWYELHDVKRKMIKGHEFAAIVRNCSPDTQCLLLKAVPENTDETYVINHLLSRLNAYDYEGMYACNKLYLRQLYNQGDHNRQQYILNVIAR